MQTIVATDHKIVTPEIALPVSRPGFVGNSVTGYKKKTILLFIWLSISIIALKIYKNPFVAFKRTKALLRLRDQYRNNHTIQKYKKANGRYFFTYNAPGWPSKAFNRYVEHLFNRVLSQQATTLHTIIFGITKKCGFKCEHCFEWENLNQPERLTREDLLYIVSRFHKAGITQVQLSGGEPLNRFDDILYLLDHSPRNIDFWIYTTGYQLTKEKAIQLKEHGLTGIIISLDHHDPVKHDTFRGKANSFDRAMQAVQMALDKGLAVAFSLCATKAFTNTDNLLQYATLAKEKGVSFIQVLEPKAVGHYAGMEVSLSKEQVELLEGFYEKMNYDSHYKEFPLITYHEYYGRRVGCSGSGKDYLYVDTDGDVHNCTFCQRKLFSALNDPLEENIQKMKTTGCGVQNILLQK